MKLHPCSTARNDQKPMREERVWLRLWFPLLFLTKLLIIPTARTPHPLLHVIRPSSPSSTRRSALYRTVTEAPTPHNIPRSILAGNTYDQHTPPPDWLASTYAAYPISFNVLKRSTEGPCSGRARMTPLRSHQVENVESNPREAAV